MGQLSALLGLPISGMGGRSRNVALAVCTRVPGGKSGRRGQDVIGSLLSGATRLVIWFSPERGEKWTPFAVPQERVVSKEVAEQMVSQ